MRKPLPEHRPFVENIGCAISWTEEEGEREVKGVRVSGGRGNRHCSGLVTLTICRASSLFIETERRLFSRRKLLELCLRLKLCSHYPCAAVSQHLDGGSLSVRSGHATCARHGRVRSYFYVWIACVRVMQNHYRFDSSCGLYWPHDTTAACEGCFAHIWDVSTWPGAMEVSSRAQMAAMMIAPSALACPARERATTCNVGTYHKNSLFKYIWIDVFCCCRCCHCCVAAVIAAPTQDQALVLKPNP